MTNKELINGLTNIRVKSFLCDEDKQELQRFVSILESSVILTKEQANKANSVLKAWKIYGMATSLDQAVITEIDRQLEEKE